MYSRSTVTTACEYPKTKTFYLPTIINIPYLMIYIPAISSSYSSFKRLISTVPSLVPNSYCVIHIKLKRYTAYSTVINITTVAATVTHFLSYYCIHNTSVHSELVYTTSKGTSTWNWEKFSSQECGTTQSKIKLYKINIWVEQLMKYSSFNFWYGQEIFPLLRSIQTSPWTYLA